MVLWEKAISWKDKRIVFQNNDHLSDWYLAINPNGFVPTLVHEGTAISDSSVINEYREDVFPIHSAAAARCPRCGADA